MVPVVCRLQFVRECGLELFTHVDDAVGHGLDVLLPLFKQRRVVEDEGHLPRVVRLLSQLEDHSTTHQTCTMSRWVADLASLENTELTPNPIGFVLRARDDVQGAHAFAIQSSVLREALRRRGGNKYLNPAFNPLDTHLADEHRYTLLFKVPHGLGVVVQISACKPLVCAIEERIMSLLQEDLGELRPLFLRRVDASRVMRACVQEKHGTRRSVQQILLQPLEIKPDILWLLRLVIPVSIFLRTDTNVLEYREMVGCK